MKAVSFSFRFSTDELAKVFQEKVATTFKCPTMRVDRDVWVICTSDELAVIGSLGKRLGGTL